MEISRQRLIQRLENEKFDLLIIGGGATGAGIALDAVTRGLKVALVEREDFASETSSRSTKLIHGGVRYLEAAFKNLDKTEFSFVYEALHERAIMINQAPYLCSSLPILIPVYSQFQKLYYLSGLKIYDWMAGKKRLIPTRTISRKEIISRFPLIKTNGLKGGVLYSDGIFNDARMNLMVILTAMKNSLKPVLGLLGAITIFLALSGLTILGIASRVERELRQGWLNKAKIAAAALDVNEIAKLTGSAQDLDNPAYLDLKKQLRRLRLATDECKFLYLMGQKHNGQVFFYMDSQMPGSKDYAPPGLIYTEVDPRYLPAFKGMASTVGPITDRWGTLITALVPIRSPQGKVIAVLGMDVQANNWKLMIFRQLLAPCTAILLFVMLLCLIFINRWQLKKTVQERTQELKKSKEELQTILYSIGDGVIVTDVKGNIIEINPMAEELTGWQKKDAINKPLTEVFNIINTLDRTPCANPVQKVLSTGHIIGLANHTSLISKDGQEYQIADSAAPIISLQGNTWGVVLTFRDVTEEYKRQIQIRDMAERYQSIFENAPIGIMYYDSQGILTECNPFFAYGIGSKREDLIGLNMLTQLKDKKLINEIKMSLTQGRGYYEDLYTSFLTGKSTYVRGFLKGIQDDKGKIIGGIGIFEDITERKMAEQKLRKTQELIHEIINSMPQILICIDLKGKIILFNRKAEQEYKIKSTQVINKTFCQALPCLKEIWPKIQTSLQHREIIYQNKVQLKKQENKFFDITIYPLLKTESSGVVLLIEDVSKQVQLEELMIQSEKMLSVGGLAAGMAHEINNPLAGIIQSAEVIQRRVTQDLPANIQAAQKAGISLQALRSYLSDRNLLKMIENIKESGFRAAEIVKNMLSFARKGGPDFANYSIVQLLDQTVELASTDYDLKKRFDFNK